MADFDFSTAAEAKMLAMEYMRQKNLTDDTPDAIAREYNEIVKAIKQTLDTLA